ncbi:bifunctional (p)ppGpp synthetase/guanosine-3',5'-bis(diphosphate) 3'-pyrophosphohydrolase [Candidatus Uhrbacteria bacterium]|nr:bifunctional (p)ppGpp synthetase/guanosine-3',5'-bis(diphosphate) 3'-pyrophosphohydrolase [Candidatus Uhrbacteria bacterium]
MADVITAYRERLIDETRRSLPASDVSLVESAADFAIAAHAGQVRISGLPYATHPLETARKLAAMCLPTDVVIAGVLHDVHEDVGVPLEEIEHRFNADVAKLVGGVTKVGKITYRGEQRYIENVRKMFIALADDVRVMFIKFADRLHNLEDLSIVPESKRVRIAREALDIYAPIANRLAMHEIKAQLEDLSFPYVYPEEARWVESLVATNYEAKRIACERLRVDTAAELQRHRITVHEAEGRLKPRYSLYQKLLRHNRDISQIYDLTALRVIVGDVADCYAVLGILHKRWKPLKGRIKDYIANPKPNGYQSLHTTVAVEDGEVVEFQIRTMAMHEEAQWGAAAAWRYHERSPTKPTARQLRWVEEFVQWQRGVKNPTDFIEGIKTEILRDRILVFTPKGDVIELPEGATPLDLAYAIHTEIGNHATGARVNGTASLHPLNQPLRNGDMVEVLTDPKRKGPSADWLSSVRTTNARSKIRDALRGTLKTKVASWVSATMPKRK